MSVVPGYQIGLKLWSVNTGESQREARRLYDAGLYDYLELYAVPGSADTLPGWKSLQIPSIIHAAHFKHGFNLAKVDCASANRRIYDEMRLFADELGARYIIFHGGTFGCISETARQLAALDDPRALIENKPAITRNEGQILECRGATVDEIKQVIQGAACGFCLDIPHALCAANYLGLEQLPMLQEMNSLRPAMYHLADMMSPHLLIDDHARLGQGRLDFAQFIPSVLAPGAMVTIETTRTRPEALEEFEREVELFRAFASGR
ncbi:MAG: hypothetical protein IKJ29_08645 [Akkermansia sp.]|nr:hypothetical protein [Akkermansia sp.]